MNFRHLSVIALTIASLAACSPYQASTEYPEPTTHNRSVDRASPQTTPSGHPDLDENDLSAYDWRLDRTVNPAGLTDQRWLPPAAESMTLSFQDGNLSVSGLCNQIGASYDTNGADMEISGPYATRRMCADQGLMQYEQQVANRLPEVASWAITPSRKGDRQPVLTLRFHDDAQWVLTGTATADTRYGGSGETRFLEVAPQTVPCADPLSERQCLYVRAVDYDAAGRKQSQQDWQPFYGAIEGYQHQPGVRNILRVKRYQRDNPPADASRYAYVLDMVVDSQVMDGMQH